MPSKRYPKGVERREQILDAAYEVLSRDGYSRASLAEIGRSLGILPANILYYFGSRERLLIEVLKRWDDVNVAAALSERKSELLSEWLRTVEANIQHPGIMQLYTAFAAEAKDPAHAAHTYFKDRFARNQAGIAALLRDAGRDGRASVPDPDGTAEILISLSDGLQIRWLIDPEFDIVDALRRSIAAAVGTTITTR